MNLDRLTSPPAGFRSVPRTGVIYVMTRASQKGYKAGSSDWANLGQGAPEVGALEGSPSRITNIDVQENDLEYAPIDGLPELRQAVADLYNTRYRKGKSSLYGVENVAICSGGRLALTRIVSTLGRSHVGHFLPDYTAYEELLDSFGTFVPMPLQLSSSNDYAMKPHDLREHILGMGLSAILLSNPCNPTGTLIVGNTLKEWIRTTSELNCTTIFDEFYSHYIYNRPELSVSAAAHVGDVNKDPVVIVDGLTKNWRYPGLRVSWTIGPKDVIEGLASAGSFLDGGCARPVQRAAIALLRPEFADQEASAIQRCFSEKREFMLSSLSALGIDVSSPPDGSFYCWGDLRNLPEHLNTGGKFFEEALKVGVITVPGVFFDINPGHRRPDRPSKFQSFARFSFGPPLPELAKGIEKLKSL